MEKISKSARTFIDPKCGSKKTRDRNIKDGGFVHYLRIGVHADNAIHSADHLE